ncbi:hypothetical protein KDD17_02005 [Sulfitobacter albidus]|uniref:Argininosuccinate lyase n=1 Tax=Sulfitobacter albidus TaxID=2829501 RepID=A0A975JF52_9RHOB|nr:hypothetical protein [Sulfitobacter albidus]QUJ76860.1 hypothetical protein KDD17_02005 [Sulfitobacter albidus]
MKTPLLIVVLVTLAACGVDGEPVQPAGGVNVTLSPSGLGVGGTVGVRKGPLTVGLGF